MVAKVMERLAIINKQHRSLMGKGLTSGSSMSWRLGKQYETETANRFCSFGNLIDRT